MSELLDTIHAAFVAGYDLGLAHGRADRARDEEDAAIHDLACRTIGLRPDNADAPRWAVAS